MRARLKLMHGPPSTAMRADIARQRASRVQTEHRFRLGQEQLITASAREEQDVGIGLSEILFKQERLTFELLPNRLAVDADRGQPLNKRRRDLRRVRARAAAGDQQRLLRVRQGPEQKAQQARRVDMHDLAQDARGASLSGERRHRVSLGCGRTMSRRPGT